MMITQKSVNSTAALSHNFDDGVKRIAEKSVKPSSQFLYFFVCVQLTQLTEKKCVIILMNENSQVACST